MADIFISYSRKDLEFVRALYAGLQRHGLDAWVDWEGIPPSVAWLQEIFAAIDTADIFLFIISPDSVASRVSRQEIEHALARNKRIIPVVYRPAEHRTLPGGVASLNSFFFHSDDFEHDLEKLVSVINTDYNWAHMHTRLLRGALEWESKRRDPSLLLRGSALREAETWLAQAARQKGPEPTPLHRQYVYASQRAARKPLGVIGGVLLALAILAVGGVIFISTRRFTSVVSAPIVQSTMTTSVDSQPTMQAKDGILGTPAILPGATAGLVPTIPVTARNARSLPGHIAFAEAPGANGPFQICVLPAEGGRVTCIGSGSAHMGVPSWSPDGQWIAFASDLDNKSQPGIYTMRADGSEQTLVTPTDLSGWHPTWAPDGKQIAFATYAQNPISIYVVTTDGGQPRRLTHTDGDPNPAWSPDGGRIAFASRANGKFAIYTMKTDGSRRQALTDSPANDQAPAWSPDGKKIAFQSDRDDGKSNIYVMNADGSQQTRLTDGGSDLSPVWSPDGQDIAFQSGREGQWEIFWVRADGSSPPRRMYASPIAGAYDADPAWGP